MQDGFYNTYPNSGSIEDQRTIQVKNNQITILWYTYSVEEFFKVNTLIERK